LRLRSSSILSVLLATAMCTALLMSSAQTSRAASSYVLSPADPAVATVCASLGGAWDGSSKCTLGGDLTLNPGDSLVIDPNAALVIQSGVTLTNGGSIEDYGTITTNAGGVLTNSGAITAFIALGSMVNEGSLANDPGGSISIEHPGQTSVQVGTFNFTNTGAFDNRGTFVSFGNFTSGAGALITNSGTFSFVSATINIGNFSAPVATNAGAFTNLPGGNLTIDGATFNNTGTLTNPGAITETQHVYSVVENFGTITSNGTISDTSFIGNNGTITNAGTITTVVGCAVAACGSLVNNALLINTPEGTIDNQGNFGNNVNATFTNDGTLTNSRVLINNPNGTIVNLGTIVSTGTLTNRASIINNGSITASGIVLNSGYISNNSNATITNSRTITNTGRIDNSGTVTNACGGVIDGAGTITGNPVSASTGCKSTTSPVPEFPAEAVVPVLLSILILVSLVYGKGRWGRAQTVAERRQEP
jgi:hypothetical protein